jgi:4-amino-4-deoxy-L-arabinose transferase-like glycosyltransferase
MFGSGRGPLFYPVAFLGDGLPWSLLLPAVLVLAWRQARASGWRADPRLLPALWCGALVLLLTLSTGKRSVYLLPLYPAYAIIAAITIERATAWRAARWLLLPLGLCAALALPATVVLGRLLPAFAAPAWPLACLFAFWGAALGACWRRRALAAAALGSALFLALGQAWFALHLDRIDPYRPARHFAERIAQEAEPGVPCGRYGVGLQSLTFYARRPFFSLRDPEALKERARAASRTYVVMPRADLPVLADDPALAAEVIAERPYLQVSLPGLLGRRPLERPLVLVRVTPRTDR